MQKTDPLELYIDLRVRLLAGDYPAGHLLLATDVAAASRVTKPAALGVLNALTTDGYLQKQGKWFSPVIWTSSMISECAERLDILIGLSGRQTAENALHKISEIPSLVDYQDPFLAVSERHYLAFMEATRLFFRAGERRGLAEVVFRLVPQAFYRTVWNHGLTLETLPGKLCESLPLQDAAQSGAMDRVAELLRTMWLSPVKDSKSARMTEADAVWRSQELASRNCVRESDVRGRLLSLSHPAYASSLPVATGAGNEPCLVVLTD